MAFKLGDVIIDRIQYGVAEDFDGNLLYTLSQLTEATINISAESKEAKDKDGTLVKKFWQGKTGTFEAKNAMLNVNVIGSASGEDPKIATSGNTIVMPKIITVSSGTTADIKGFVEGSVYVYAYGENGNMGKAYAKGTSASATEFGLTADGKFTPPTDTNETRYIVKYNRTVSDGLAVYNKADKFPGTVKLTLKALCVDPCEADTLRACYIVLPSFQVSPEVSISLQTDAQADYKGDLQVAYCSGNKTLYEFYMAAEDEE